jgi:hypothetical protein
VIAELPAKPASPTSEEAVRIGREVLAARAEGVAWKVLVRRYDLSRQTLWVYACVASAATTER